MSVSSNDCMVTDNVIEWDNKSNENEQEKMNLVLVGKLWSSKPVNIKAAINTICDLWRRIKLINVVGNVMDSKSKTFMFKFENELFKKWVLEDQPWHFDGFVWCFNEPNPSGKISDVSLVHVPSWVRVYDLPFQGRSNIENARRIANVLGGFLDFDKTLLPEVEMYMRIRVLHDVREPLKQDVAIRMIGGCVSKFSVKYERLPMFCYGCGVLGHGVKKCEDGPFEEGTYGFGAWNMVNPRKATKAAKEKENGCTSRNLIDAVEDESLMGLVRHIRIA